jgi:hypothetical protein
MKKLIAILLCTPSLALAEFYSGNILLSKMQSTSSIDRSVAIGYVVGVYDTMKDVAFCPPANVTVGQIHDMVKQALEQIPSIRNNTGDIIVQGVLGAEWPCNHGKKGKAI